MKLYQITSSLESLWEKAGDVLDSVSADPAETGLALVFLEKELRALEGEHVEKCLNVACLIKNIEAEAVAIKAEEQKLSERRKNAERKAEWLRTYLANNLKPGETLRDAKAVITWRKSTAVEVAVAPELLPENLRRTKTVIEADKAAIKINLEAGQLVDGCSLVQRLNLQIK